MLLSHSLLADHDPLSHFAKAIVLRNPGTFHSIISKHCFPMQDSPRSLITEVAPATADPVATTAIEAATTGVSSTKISTTVTSMIL